MALPQDEFLATRLDIMYRFNWAARVPGMQLNLLYFFFEAEGDRTTNKYFFQTIGGDQMVGPLGVLVSPFRSTS